MGQQPTSKNRGMGSELGSKPNYQATTGPAYLQKKKKAACQLLSECDKKKNSGKRLKVQAGHTSTAEILQTMELTLLNPKQV